MENNDDSVVKSFNAYQIVFTWHHQRTRSNQSEQPQPIFFKGKISFSMYSHFLNFICLLRYTSHIFITLFVLLFTLNCLPNFSFQTTSSHVPLSPSLLMKLGHRSKIYIYSITLCKDNDDNSQNWREEKKYNNDHFLFKEYLNVET